MPPDLSRFISLGANCEFGFYLRDRGERTASLLRWTVTPPEALLAGLRSGFDGIFRFEALRPFQAGMVADRGSGLSFHSKLASAKGEDGRLRFVADEATRRALHAPELEKFLYMRGKLLEEMKAGGRIFVYRHGDKTLRQTLELMDAITDEVRRHNPGNTLLFVFKEGGEPGSVRRVRDGLLHGYLDRFAPNHRAADLSHACWDAVCAGAAALAGLESPPVTEATAATPSPTPAPAGRWWKRLTARA